MYQSSYPAPEFYKDPGCFTSAADIKLFMLRLNKLSTIMIGADLVKKRIS